MLLFRAMFGRSRRSTTLAALLVAAGGALAGCGSQRTSVTTAAQSTGIPRELWLQARPIGRGARFHPPATGPVLGPCRTQLGPRAGVHVEVFAANRVILLPTGIGTRPPLRFSAGRIARAGCYGALVTIDPTGLVLVRPGAGDTIASLFRSWGQPLTRRRIASFTAATPAPVRVFVGGRSWRGPPGAVLLRRHAEIVLEVGPYVPPHSAYTFPPGL